MDLRELQETLAAKTEIFDKAVEAGTSPSELLNLYKEIKALKHDILLKVNPTYWFALGREVQTGQMHPAGDSLRPDVNAEMSTE